MPETKGEQNGEQNGESNQNSAIDSKHTDSGSSGNSSGTESENSDGKIREMVREEIKEALKGLKPDGDGTPAPRRTDIEAAAERMVREASERLKSQEQHAEDHERLRNGNPPAKDDKPEPESAPKKVRKLTKILWGESD